MRKDIEQAKNELLGRQARPVKLRVAASIALHVLTGQKRDALREAREALAKSGTATDLAG